MSEIIIFSYFIVMAVSLDIILDKKFGFALPLSMFLSTLITIVGGYLNNLRLGFVMTLILPIVAICIFLKNIIFTENRKQYIIGVIKNTFTFGMIIFTAMYLIMCFIHHNTAIIEWDEITFWSPLVREMIETNKFYYSAESHFFGSSGYPPFMQTFEFMCCLLGRRFEERFLYLGLSSITVALFCSVVDFDDKETRIQYKIVNGTLLILSVLFINLLHFVTEHPIGGAFT